MDRKILYTLDLKFKRHNLVFEYNEATKTLTIGKTRKLVIKYIIGVLIILFCFFIAFFFSFLPFQRLIFLLLSSVGFVMISNAYKLSQNSKYLKKFSPNSVELSSKYGTTNYDAERINDFTYHIQSYKDSYNGKLFITSSDDSEIELITLVGKDKKHLHSDFIYLRQILRDHVGVNK